MDLVIRRYRNADKAACIIAFKSNMPKYFADSEIADFDKFLDKMSLPETHEITHESWTHYYVILHDEDIIACGGFGYKNGTENISLAWGLAHNNFHGKGIGKLLLKHRIQELRLFAPGKKLILDTTQHTFTFFEKFGFKTLKITENAYAPNLHRYDMEYCT